MGTVEESHAQRHQVAVAGLIDTYGEIKSLLSRLPLPVQVPSLQGELYRGEVRIGLVQAFTVVGDLPMDGEARQVLREVVGDWLIAVEFMFCDEEDEAAWHLQVVQTQLGRIQAMIDAVEALLAAPTGH
jgi:hypothetical protein